MQGIMLKRLGHNVHILDQSLSSNREDNGAGITVGPEAQEFYKRYDLVQKPYSIPDPGVRFLNTRSEVRYFMKRPMEMSSWSLLYYRLRANFDEYISDLCQIRPAYRRTMEMQSLTLVRRSPMSRMRMESLQSITRTL